MTAEARLRTLAHVLSVATGVTVDITIRGETSFTWSFEGRNDAAAAKLVRIAEDGRSHATVEVTQILSAEESGTGEPELLTCVYVEA